MKQKPSSFSSLAILGAIVAGLAGFAAVTMYRQQLPGVEAHSPATVPKKVVASRPHEIPIPEPLPAPPRVKDSSATLPLQELAARVQPKGAVPNEAVLTFKSAAALSDFINRAAAEGLVVKGRIDSMQSARIAFDSLDKLRQELLDHGADYAGIGANFPVQTPGLPPPEQRPGGGDVPFGNSLLAAIGAGPDVDRSQWGSGVTVAVVDSGVTAHPTFTAGQVAHVDLVNDGQPFEGHGTAIASLIAGNAPGAQGVAPAASILDVRIGGADGSDSFLLARGIEMALSRGAQVINVSMGSYGDAPIVSQAVQDAIQRGVIVVASVGNDSAAVKNWPAAYPGVISVSGVDATGQLAYFSNSGDPTIAAPGVGVPSAYAEANKPYLATGDGTSQAAALVSGAVAAILSQGGDVVSTLSNNATKIPATKQQAG
ncbi:MAG TPA: S8 family serine peptidase, partial [Verrucomicrobiaceae bacterium]